METIKGEPPAVMRQGRGDFRAEFGQSVEDERSATPGEDRRNLRRDVFEPTEREVHRLVF